MIWDKKEWRFAIIGVIIVLVIVVCVVCFVPASSAETEKKVDAFHYFLNPERDYLIVVNQNSPYDFDSDPLLQEEMITTIDAVDGDPIRVEGATYVAFCLLKDELAFQGMEIGIYDGYRTKEQQENIYNYYANLEGWAENNSVMLPGMSEHHTGLLLNVVIKYSEDGSSPIWYTETAERQEKIPYFKLLHETLADFGFIDRYPAGKEDITGVKCEPYEIRFVGSSKIAHAIMDNHITLEEYLAHREDYE